MNMVTLITFQTNVLLFVLLLCIHFGIHIFVNLFSFPTFSILFFDMVVVAFTRVHYGIAQNK